VRFDEWFLTAAERQNAASGIDDRREDGSAWTEGNRVEVLVHGSEYFALLADTLAALGPGDSVCLTDWRGDADERLDGPGTEIGRVLCDAARRSVEVRGLLWRSHPRQMHFAEQANLTLVKEANAAGAELLLDERVRVGGSHHQKVVVVKRADPGDDVAFAGGIDLCHGRNDDRRHLGDAQAVSLDPN
jgi:phosphatidylserine/phosphatidylglycerophosphate/cardiolipin synthase-like enzyme